MAFVEKSKTRLYIGVPNLTDKDLQEKFKTFGEIVEVSSRGDYAFVQMAKPEEAEAAHTALNAPNFRVEFANENRRRRDGPGGERGSTSCFQCGRDGHFLRDCPNATSKDKNRCFNCNEVGHMARDCANPRVRERRSRSPVRRSPGRRGRSPGGYYRDDYRRDRSPPRYPPRYRSRSPPGGYRRSPPGGYRPRSPFRGRSPYRGRSPIGPPPMSMLPGPYRSPPRGPPMGYRPRSPGPYRSPPRRSPPRGYLPPRY